MKYFSINLNGLVQGIGFRYFCFRLALRYDIKGYVENLSDGSVFLDIEADDNIVNAFLDELRIGPRFAVINSFKIEEKKYENKYSDFQIY